MARRSFKKLKLDETRILEIEKEVLQQFHQFNLIARSMMEQYVLPDGTVDLPGFSEGYRRSLVHFGAGMHNVYLQGGRLAAESGSAALGQTVAFDPMHPVALNTAQQIRDRVMAGLQQKQLEAIQELRTSLANQTPIRSTAEVRESINLTARQIQHNRSYRTLLENNNANALRRTLRDKRSDGKVRAAIKKDKVLSTDQIDRMVSAYSKRQLDHRAKVIASTEAVKIANQSDHDFYEQAIDRGEIDRTRVRRKWINSKDVKVRDTHVDLGRTEAITQGEVWTSSSGAVLQFPGDPSAPAEETIQCRCWVETSIAAA